MTDGEEYFRFLAGDENALGDMIKAYRDGLVLYLLGYVKNMHDAEELAEDVFVRIITRKPVFYQKSSFKTWLYAIARNLAIDFLRRKKYNDAFEKLEISDEKADIEKSYLKEENKILLHRAMDKLKPEYRQVLWLVYFENFSAKEASKVMKKSVHATETLIYRAKQSLKKEITDNENFR